MWAQPLELLNSLYISLSCNYQIIWELSKPFMCADIYLCGANCQRGSTATGAGRHCRPSGTGGESNPSGPLSRAQPCPAALSPSPDPPVHGILFCDADVLPVIDHPPLSWGPESDLLDAFVRNQLGNKNKNLKASSGQPEIRGPQSLFSLAWQNSPHNKKIHKKIFCFQGLKRDFHFAHPVNMIPSLCKKINVSVRGEEGQKAEKERR